jgi:hypothetical protein
MRFLLKRHIGQALCSLGLNQYGKVCQGLNWELLC